MQNREKLGEIRLILKTIITELKNNKISVSKINDNLYNFNDLNTIEKQLNIRVEDYYNNVLNIP
jgi:hypothetical protein